VSEPSAPAPSPRIAVYAIARDEETQLERWADAHADADVLLIADTGSTDRTVSRGRELGIDVREIDIEPFRFDVARNRALDLLPDRINLCASIDLDEASRPAGEPGSRRHGAPARPRFAAPTHGASTSTPRLYDGR
jgi:hypothetical protein